MRSTTPCWALRRRHFKRIEKTRIKQLLCRPFLFSSSTVKFRCFGTVYAPQFQLVELAFSKIKGHFRQFWPWDDGVVKQVEKSIMTLRGTDNIGFFKHAEKCLRNKLNEIGDAGCTIISG